MSGSKLSTAFQSMTQMIPAVSAGIAQSIAPEYSFMRLTQLRLDTMQQPRPCYNQWPAGYKLPNHTSGQGQHCRVAGYLVKTRQEWQQVVRPECAESCKTQDPRWRDKFFCHLVFRDGAEDSAQQACAIPSIRKSEVLHTGLAWTHFHPGPWNRKGLGAVGTSSDPCVDTCAVLRVPLDARKAMTDHVVSGVSSLAVAVAAEARA